jgi:hypothetical protein
LLLLLLLLPKHDLLGHLNLDVRALQLDEFVGMHVFGAQTVAQPEWGMAGCKSIQTWKYENALTALN